MSSRSSRSTSRGTSHQTPRRRRGATNYKNKDQTKLFYEKELKIIKKNQEIMRKQINKLNEEVKELKNEKSRESLPEGMYMGGGK